MDRTTLQQLAMLRLRDAEALLDAGQWDGAYYLLGYCVECALKACAARRFLQHHVPDKKLINDFYTHRLELLRELAELNDEMKIQEKMDADFEFNWTAVSDWKESERYNIGRTEAGARQLHNAVINKESGILPWLTKRW
jgi:hypothetical protein